MKMTKDSHLKPKKSYDLSFKLQRTDMNLEWNGGIPGGRQEAVHHA